jgi:hypothetical protein
MAKLKVKQTSPEEFSASFNVRLLCLHDWATSVDTGKTCYQRCRRCYGRRALQRPGGKPEPIDLHWVEYGRWMTNFEIRL